MFNPFRNFFIHSIQTKIFVAFSLVTLLAVAAVSSIWYINSSGKLEEKTANSIRDNIQYANNNLEILIKDLDNINLVIATNQLNVLNILTSRFDSPNYQWFLEFKKTRSFLNAMFNYKQSFIQGIAVVGLNGDIYKVGEPLIDKNIFTQPWSATVLKAAGKTVIIKRNELGINSAMDATDKMVITIGRAVMDNGKPVGIAIIDMKYELVSQFFKIKSLAGNSSVLVLDSHRQKIFQSDSASDKILTTNQVNQILREKNRQPSFTELGGQKYLVYSYYSDYTGWTTLGIIPRKALLKDFIITRNQTMAAVILILLLVFIVSMGVASQVTRNLKQLRNTIRSIEDGDLTATPRLTSRDEVGQLSESFTRMMEHIQALVREVTAKEKQKRLTELKALQAQISPHFLYNTLNTIKYLALLQNVDNIAEVTTSLIDLLRFSVADDRQFVTIREEVEYIRKYLAIQKYKYADKFTVVYQLEEGIESFQTLKMVLQPIIENALIHGIDPLNDQGLITVKIYCEADQVKIRVSDNGPGMSREQIDAVFRQEFNQNRSRFSGIGLKNVDERIKLFFGPDYGLKIDSQPGMYTAVEITIPIIQEGHK